MWGSAALGEEIIFRGVILPDLAARLPFREGSWILSLLVTSLLFGLSHFYQGGSGMAGTAVAGVIFGSVIRRSGAALQPGALWAAVFAHGLYDTYGVVTLFLRGTSAVT